jgi:hypothetical protein
MHILCSLFFDATPHHTLSSSCRLTLAFVIGRVARRVELRALVTYRSPYVDPKRLATFYTILSP